MCDIMKCSLREYDIFVYFNKKELVEHPTKIDAMKIMRNLSLWLSKVMIKLRTKLKAFK